MTATVYERDNCAAEQGMAFRVLSLKKGIQFHRLFTIYKTFSQNLVRKKVEDDLFMSFRQKISGSYGTCECKKMEIRNSRFRLFPGAIFR